jgi:hypothetical protein
MLRLCSVPGMFIFVMVKWISVDALIWSLTPVDLENIRCRDTVKVVFRNGVSFILKALPMVVWSSARGRDQLNLGIRLSR